MGAEKGDDAAAGVATGWLVVAGRTSFAIALTQIRQPCGVVVVDQAMPRVGVSLDVVVDARRGEHWLEAIGNAAPRPQILGAVAGNDRTGIG